VTATPTEPSLRELASQRRRRGWFVLAIGVLLLLSLVLPHVTLRGVRDYGSSLLLSGFYFLHVSAAEFGPPADQAQLSLGFNVLYLGFGLHEGGLLLSAATFWSVWPDEINRWIYRLLVIGAWLLALSPPFVILGWLLIENAGVPADLGLAWITLLISGVALVLAARRAKTRIDNTWYSARPELM